MDNSHPQRSDEIDLGQLLKMIANGFTAIFRVFLRFFLYLKRNAIKLFILVVIGAAIGFGLNQIISKSLKTDVIVKPNGDSVDYLYDVVEEINTNLKVKDTAFGKELGINMAQMDNLKVTIEPLEKSKEDNIEDKIKYIEALEKFRGDPVISDIIRMEIRGNSTLNHKLTIHFQDPENGRRAAEQIVDYINANPYYKELTEISQDNARNRINQNTQLVAQIDTLVSAYSSSMRRGAVTDTRITLAEDEGLDLPGLLNLKNVLLRDIEQKKLEIQGEKEAIRVINFGATQQVKKSFFGRTVVLIPLILVGVFILIDILKYLNRKAEEILN